MTKVKEIFMKDWFFIVIVMMLCSGVLGSVHMFMTNGTGYMNVMVCGQMLQSGDFAAVAGFGGGFLIARVLEGPLVGILDIGGAIMAGVGGGVAGLLYAAGMGWVIENFVFALLAGLVVGAIMGSVIMLVRKLVPDGIQAGGTDIMMGVGHQLANWMAPLFLVSALSASIPIGIFGAVGGAIAYKFDKNLVGGIIIGILLAAFLWPLAPVQ